VDDRRFVAHPPIDWIRVELHTRLERVVVHGTDLGESGSSTMTGKYCSRSAIRSDADDVVHTESRTRIVKCYRDRRDKLNSRKTNFRRLTDQLPLMPSR
jgi:hypothetical protein